MMVTTHVLMSVALAAVSLPFLPAGASPPLVFGAAFVGGLAPDLDLVAVHRRSLHYPVVLPVLAVGLWLLALVVSAPLVAVGAVGVTAAALHSVSDVFAGSTEPEPWDPASEQAVYNHVLGGWHRPRRYVRYSGAPEDFFVAALFALVAIESPATTAGVEASLLGLLTLSAVFVLFRKRLPAAAGRLASWVPTTVHWVFPTVRVERTDAGGTTLEIRFRS